MRQCILTDNIIIGTEVQSFPCYPQDSNKTACLADIMEYVALNPYQ